MIDLTTLTGEMGPEKKLDFVQIYEENGFGCAESRSGQGSTMAQTKLIREVLPVLFRELKLTSILDAPCGDFHWMRHVDRNNAMYIGGDIVPQLVDLNKVKYNDDKTDFRVIDIVNDPIPCVDLIMCRDCLVHLPLKDAVKAVENFKASGSRYLLCTTFPETLENEERFRDGMWRAVNLTKPPFILPKPLKMITEGCTEAVGLLDDKALGLWDLQGQ